MYTIVYVITCIHLRGHSGIGVDLALFLARLLLMSMMFAPHAWCNSAVCASRRHYLCRGINCSNAVTNREMRYGVLLLPEVVLIVIGPGNTQCYRVKLFISSTRRYLNKR